jgi:tRNA (guanine37-N1)-methyltransferase
VNFHAVTIFPEFFQGPFEHGVVARAAQSGLLSIAIHNLRDWATDRHQTVDDRPFGGGEGMVLKPAPLFDAVEAILPTRTAQDRVILLSATGKRFTQSDARRLSAYQNVVLLCGRYEGVDQRVADHLADEELSIGDFVLSGGELAAAVILDATARLLPGVLGNAASALNESFSEDGVLDCPQYTRPADFRTWTVPEVLLNGNHEEIRKWRKSARQPLDPTEENQ